MKNNFVKIISGTVLMFLIITTLGFGLVFAQNESPRGGRFEGTWNARVMIRNCRSGAEIRSFDSIGTFMFGGTMLDSTSGVPQALKTPGHGVWSHITANTYQFSFKSFSFDPSGNFTGWTIVRHRASLYGDYYQSQGTSEFYDANGNLLATGCSSTTATRFE
jgi:hypothetical protein